MIRSQDVQTVAAQPRTTPRSFGRAVRIRLLLLITDALTVGLGLIIAYLVRFETNLPLFYDTNGSPASYYSQLILVMIPFWLGLFALSRLYTSEILFGGLDEYARVFNACTTGIMLVMVATFLLPGLIIARGWLLLSWFSVTALAEVGRFAVRRLVYRMRLRGYFQTPVLIVGADEEGKAVADQLMANPKAGIALAGFVDDNLPRGTEVLNGLHVLGPTHSLRGMIHQFGIQELIISTTALSRTRLLDIFQTFGTTEEIGLRLSSGLFEIMTTGLRVRSVGNVPLLSINRVRLTDTEVVLKRVLDFVGAVLGLILLAPVFAVIAVAIKRSSPGPVLHRRRVVGTGGTEFDAFKFRTMVVNADEMLERDPELKAEYRQNFKLRDDPRVTPVGEFLRTTSLDELPQLLNVLRGQMSLVGPRMIVKEETEKYGKWGTNLLTVKPGITGLWQINGRSDVDYEGRVRLDMHYIRNYTIWMDLQILFQTIPSVLRKKGAY